MSTLGSLARAALGRVDASAARLRTGLRRLRPGGKRILVIDDMLPDPRFGAGYPRAAEMLRVILEAGWRATVYPMHAALDQYRPVRRLFRGDVHFAASTGKEGLRRLLRKSGDEYDVILVSRPTVMKAYLDVTRPPFPGIRARRVYDAEAVFAVRDAARAELFPAESSGADFAAALRDELALADGAAAVVTVNEFTAGLFAARTDAPVHTVSHCVPVRRGGPGFAERADLLFVGRLAGRREESPNVDSVTWFVEEVMPLLDRMIGPDYRLIVAGLADDALRARLGSGRVEFKGIVDELAPLYDAARLFVAPTRFAAGLPLKLVEAAAMGVPCAATDLLIEQLGFARDREIAGGSTPDTFAAACARLYADADHWDAVRSAALDRVAATFSPVKFRASLLSALDPSRNP